MEGIGLWLAKRWGEYFAMVATSIFLPYEIYDLSVKITWLRVGAFAVNLLLVVYLVWTSGCSASGAAGVPMRRSAQRVRHRGGAGRARRYDR